MASPEGKASPNLAQHLALETEMPISTAATLLRIARLDRTRSIASGFASGAALAVSLGSPRRGRRL